MMHSPLSTFTSTQSLASSRTSISTFATRAPTPNCKNSSIESLLMSLQPQTSILLLTWPLMYLTQIPQPCGGGNSSSITQWTFAGCPSRQHQIIQIQNGQAQFKQGCCWAKGYFLKGIAQHHGYGGACRPTPMRLVGSTKVCLFFIVYWQCLTVSFLEYQLEWSKSYARSKRWEEEVQLLKEEMWQTLEFFKWKSSLWSSKASLKLAPSSSSALGEGLSAYAFQQASIFMSLHHHFLSLWQGLKVLDSSPNQPTQVSLHLEEEMQGVNGGNTDLG